VKTIVEGVLDQPSKPLEIANGPQQRTQISGRVARQGFVKLPFGKTPRKDLCSPKTLAFLRHQKLHDRAPEAHAVLKQGICQEPGLTPSGLVRRQMFCKEPPTVPSVAASYGSFFETEGQSFVELPSNAPARSNTGPNEAL